MSLSVKGYRHISSVAEETKQKVKKIMSGELVPLITSIEKENKNIGGLFPGDQIALAGRTGVGKTAKALHDIKDYADPDINPFYKDKLLILYDTWEMLPWRGSLRMISRDMGMTVQQLVSYIDRLEEEQFDRLQMAADELKDLPIYFSNISVDANRWYEEKLDIAGQYTDKFLINLVDHTRLVNRKNEHSEEALITKLVVNGMRLKQKIECVNIFLSQMNRNIETGAKSREEIGNHLPVASDIFGADSVYQTSDIVVAYHRPGMYGLTNFKNIPTGIDLADLDKVDTLWLERVLKNRDGWSGTIALNHDIANNRFSDPSEPPSLYDNQNV